MHTLIWATILEKKFFFWSNEFTLMLLRMHVVSECSKWIVWILFILFAFPISDRVQYIFVNNETKSNKLKQHNNIFHVWELLTNSTNPLFISIHKTFFSIPLAPSWKLQYEHKWETKQTKWKRKTTILSSHAEIHNEIFTIGNKRKEIRKAQTQQKLQINRNN